MSRRARPDEAEPDCEGSSRATQSVTAPDAGEASLANARRDARRAARAAAAEGCAEKRCASGTCRYVETSISTETELSDEGMVVKATSSGRCACEGTATTADAPGECSGTSSATEYGVGITGAESRADARRSARAAAAEGCAGKRCADGACRYKETSIEILDTQRIDEDGGVVRYLSRARSSGTCACPP